MGTESRSTETGPREQWPPPPPGQSVAMDSIPLDVGEILAEAAETNGGADPGTVMGHVHLKVSDLARSIAFYQDALGLDLRAQLGPQAAFLAAGGYHHHVGINVWHSRGGGPPPPGSAGPGVVRARAFLPRRAGPDGR